MWAKAASTNWSCPSCSIKNKVKNAPMDMHVHVYVCLEISNPLELECHAVLSCPT